MRADTATQRSFDTLIAATLTDDYDRFVSVGDDRFRKGITTAMFHGVSQSLAPRLSQGCTPTYLGQLRQGQGLVSLAACLRRWRRRRSCTDEHGAGQSRWFRHHTAIQLTEDAVFWILFVISIIGRRLRALSAPAAELWLVHHNTRTE